MFPSLRTIFFFAELIRKHSNFISFPIVLNKIRINNVQALWLLEPSQITPDMVV